MGCPGGRNEGREGGWGNGSKEILYGVGIKILYICIADFLFVSRYGEKVDFELIALFSLSGRKNLGVNSTA